MAGLTVKFELSPDGLEDLMKSEGGIAGALLEKGNEIASKNSSDARRYIHDSRGFSNDPYVAEVRTLERTQVCVIHSTNAIAAAIGRKHGLPSI